MRLRKLLKDFVCRIGLGHYLIQYCDTCGVREPLVWWCEDSSLWQKVIGADSATPCPSCFSNKALSAGIFIRWYPCDTGAFSSTAVSGESASRSASFADANGGATAIPDQCSLDPDTATSFATLSLGGKK